MIKWIALGVVAALVLLFIFFPVVAWILVGLAALSIALALFVPIGADVAYIKKQFSLSARWGGLALKLYPRKPPDPNKPPKEEKPKKEKKPKEPAEEKKEKKSGPKFKIRFTKEEFFELLQRGFKGLGKFGKLKVRKFILHYIAAGDDPYNTVRVFNFVNGFLSAMAPLCSWTFDVGDVDAWTAVDFEAKNMTLDTELSITLRLIQLLRAGLAVAFGALIVFIKNRRRLKKEEKLAAKNAVPAETDENGAVPEGKVDVTVTANKDNVRVTVSDAVQSTDYKIRATDDNIEIKINDAEEGINIPIIDLDQFVDEENDWNLKD